MIVTLPETTHIHPSPTGHLSILQQSPADVYSPDSHNDPSALPRSRSRSNRSSKLPQKPVHSSTHPHSSNHSYPHPPARPSSNPRLPPTMCHSGSTVQRPLAGFSSHIGPHPHPHPPSHLPDLYPTLNKRTQQNFHVGSQQSSSHTGSGISPSQRHGHGPLSIVYAQSSFPGDESNMIGGSSSSSVTIGPPTNRDNPQLRPYSSSTDLHSNGSLCDASFVTSPSLCLTHRS
ncbi:hypothetical protein BGY98DRAFT_149151 [Russula aff. rugulosa BPL654]|nr:hypothetical protein BGY98DRAFT_149151 [Russula aff. rugulosa BPL654]